MNVDLNELRIDHQAEALPARRSSRVWMVAFFLLLAASAVAIALVLWQDRSEASAVAVRVEAIRAEKLRASGAETRGAFSAAGWIKLPLDYPIHVTPLIAGRLEEVTVVEGDAVTTGQLLARLYDGDLAGELLAAEAKVQAAVAAHEKSENGYRPQEVAEAAAEVERLQAELHTAREVLAHSRELQPSGAISLEELQTDEARVKSLQASLKKAQERHALMQAGFRQEEVALAAAAREEAEALRDLAKLRLGYAEIKSPIDGVVLERRSRRGAWVTPGEGAIVSLFDPTALEARVDVNQDDLGKVFRGQRVEITSRAEPGKRHRGEVVLIEPQADVVKNTVPVRVRITPEADRMLYPDMVVTARFLPEASAPAGDSRVEPSPMTVATVAVRRDGAQAFVWVVRDGLLQRQEVELGRLDGGRYEVQSGLQGGERVVIEPTGELTAGTEVRVLN